MTIRQDAALRHLRTLFGVGTLGDLTDGQLLERFASSRGEPSEPVFAALVERHAPLVWRVCRSVLRNDHDAEDAFQATFLVLVRKARSLWVRDSLGPWLHQVAYRVAWCARRTAARRKAHERRASLMKSAQVAHEPDQESLGWGIHREIERLPERYRNPVILCDLEGCSYEQAARHLECPVGTIKSRLARGREILRSRLTRRGLALAVLATPPAEQVSPRLLETTIKAAVRFAAGTAPVSAGSAYLVRNVLRSLLMEKVKLATLSLATAGLLAGGAALSAHPVEEADGPSVALAVPVPAQSKEAPKTAQRAIAEPRKGRPSDIINEVQGQTSIIMIVPEGSHVKKGDVICELDSSALRDQLTNQVIAVKAAEAAYHNARLARETAEIAVTEFVDGTGRLEEQTTESAMQLAKAELELADERLAAVQKDPQAKSLERKQAEVDRIRASNALRDSQLKLDVLTRYTIPRRTRELKSEVQKFRAIELAKQAAWELEKSKEEKLNRLITKCTIRAPVDGEVVYFDRRPPAKALKSRQIEEGALVRERQGLILIYPDNPEDARK